MERGEQSRLRVQRLRGRPSEANVGRGPPLPGLLVDGQVGHGAAGHRARALAPGLLCPGPRATSCSTPLPKRTSHPSHRPLAAMELRAGGAKDPGGADEVAAGGRGSRHAGPCCAPALPVLRVETASAAWLAALRAETPRPAGLGRPPALELQRGARGSLLGGAGRALLRIPGSPGHAECLGGFVEGGGAGAIAGVPV